MLESKQFASSSAFDNEVEHTCLHHLFEAQVEQTPGAPALVFENTQLTYRELNEKANQLAHYLQRLDVGPEVLVGICVERSPEMIVGLLATLKAGGAFIPLDPSHPQERLDFMLQDSQATVVLTQQYLVQKLPQGRRVSDQVKQGGGNVTIVCLDTDFEIIGQEPVTNPVSAVSSENLAYVIYTSGSTGKPKGVLITHGSIARHSRAMADYYQLDGHDRVLQFTTLTFDISLEQIFPTLIAGACLVLRGPEVWSTAEFHEKVQRFGLTVMNLATPYWHQLAQEWVHAPERVQATQLRLVVVGGDKMLPQYVQLWQQTPLGSVRLLNAYGPAETTITSTIFEVPAPDEQATPLEHIPIGRPLPYRTMYILDEHGNPVPVGEVGELYIGGSILARGYLNRPALTAERFITDPFSEDPEARLYKTGDLTRYLPDGHIVFIGRADHQLKIRGHRVEPGEIASRLNMHPAVQTSVVVAREDMTGEKRLVAYIVSAERASIMVSDLQQHLAEDLPDYMIPATFVLLDALPITPNGKVDRQALPAPTRANTLRDEVVALPSTPTEERVAEIIASVLGLEVLGVDENFFLLGGHSLLGAQVIARVAEIFGIELPLRVLFDRPTVRELSVTIEQELIARIEAMSDEEVQRLLQDGV